VGLGEDSAQSPLWVIPTLGAGKYLFLCLPTRMLVVRDLGGGIDADGDLCFPSQKGKERQSY